jgi:hypothetical protein
MVSTQSQSVIDRAKAIYDERWRADLESTHPGEFLAIEPESAQFWLADSFSEAMMQAHRAFPERLSYVLRIGQDAALHIGELRS